jgi:hypothetical protein
MKTHQMEICTTKTPNGNLHNKDTKWKSAKTKTPNGNLQKQRHQMEICTTKTPKPQMSMRERDPQRERERETERETEKGGRSTAKIGAKRWDCCNCGVQLAQAPLLLSAS